MKTLLVCAALACIFSLIYTAALPDKGHHSSESSGELTNKTNSNRGSKNLVGAVLIFKNILVERGTGCGMNETEIALPRPMPIVNGSSNGTNLPIQPFQRNDGPLQVPPLAPLSV